MLRIAWVSFLSATAWAGRGDPLPAQGFDVFTDDPSGGGWVIHHHPGRGDSLWGCPSLAQARDCRQVLFDDWRTGAELSFMHVSQEDDRGWLRLRVPGGGDTLLACADPGTQPSCAAVPLELLPEGSYLRRTWPRYDGHATCDGPESRDPRCVIEPAERAVMWLEGGPRSPGPLNLYACQGLAEGEPRCRLNVPNWLAETRDDLGLRKLEDRVVRDRDGQVVDQPGVRVGRLDAEGAAYAAGLREGDVVVRVGSFDTTLARHLRQLLLQYPARSVVQLHLEDGRTVALEVPQRTGR